MVDVEDILQVTTKPVFDARITSREFHSYYPYPTAGFGTNMEIRIPIHHQDLYTLPHTSRLILEGHLLKTPAADGTDNNAFNDNTHKLTTNGYAHLFSQIRYELAGQIIDQITDPGIATTLKGLASFEKDSQDATTFLQLQDTWNVNNGYFVASIPLKHSFGFYEDWKNIIINIRQELVLLRSNTNNDAIYTTDASMGLKIEKIYWDMEHITVDDKSRLQLTNTLRQDDWLDLTFMGWELNTYPTLLQTKQHTWTIKTAPQVQTPRYMILAFQTDRRGKKTKAASGFDHIELKTARLYLNGNAYPYNVPRFHLSSGEWCFAYHAFCDFQKTYYDKLVSRPLIDAKDFYNHYPIFIINCSSQGEAVKGGSVDVTIKWETNADVPAVTSAYCLFLHDRHVQYKPMTSAVQIKI